MLSASGREDVLRVATRRLHLHAEPVEQEALASGLHPDIIVFLSKHVAKSGRPSLAVHPVGNFGEARYGGQPGRLTPTLGAWQSQALRLLAARRKAHAYPAEVTFEVTHHGPLLETPAVFIELGSGPAQWRDPAGARVLAEAAWELTGARPAARPVVVGLGGGHYAPRFTEAVLTKEVDFAHMVPTHAAEQAPSPMRLAAELKRASPGCQAVYVHRGTLPGAVEEAWISALAGAGIPRTGSRSWAAPP